MKSVSAVHSFLVGFLGVGTNSLEQLSKRRVSISWLGEVDGAVRNVLEIHRFWCRSHRGQAVPTGFRAGTRMLTIVQETPKERCGQRQREQRFWSKCGVQQVNHLRLQLTPPLEVSWLPLETCNFLCKELAPARSVECVWCGSNIYAFAACTITY